MRLDSALVHYKLVESREKAKYLIKEGRVCIGGVVVNKPSKNVPVTINRNGQQEHNITLKAFEFVGRGAYKLDNAIKAFSVSCEGKIVADVGCSVGGFTDYALQKGAKKVYAIDNGDTLHESLRNNPSIGYLPHVDARTLESLGEEIDLVLVDVTFAPLEEVLLITKRWMKEGAEVVALIKPPFEQQHQEKQSKLKKVNDKEHLNKISMETAEWSRHNGYIVEGLIESPMKGKTSHQTEFFIYLKKKTKDNKEEGQNNLEEKDSNQIEIEIDKLSLSSALQKEENEE